MERVLVDDLSEPTMGEKLASLNIVDDDGKATHGNEEREKSTRLTKPSFSDSVNILLRQALHADDHALLLDCLYTLDEKVIENSVLLLNPSDVLILLHSLVSLIQSRGAVLACALPWIKSLLHQHASGIVSQESSLHTLNSLYQLIESRASTFESALQVSSCLDFLYAGIVEEENATIPLIYEDEDESDEEESEDAMDTDQNSEEGEGLDEGFDGRRRKATPENIHFPAALKSWQIIISFHQDALIHAEYFNASIAAAVFGDWRKGMLIA
ncbi:hypothetical protein SLEP1_g21798 [Rubroshorea leprosula]|uniref:Small-subunit processome Utp12 domain-containing protein n=1 Tax=Rubroshorea leprosula TaxID=152421 RepID=A0AAV5JAB3_9ROSI|nr:hypothetical protein SLEP1_g21798 [Rubroshorea leprosula]